MVKASSKPQEPNILKKRILEYSTIFIIEYANGRLTKHVKCTKCHNSHHLPHHTANYYVPYNPLTFFPHHTVVLCAWHPEMLISSYLTTRQSSTYLTTRVPSLVHHLVLSCLLIHHSPVPRRNTREETHEEMVHWKRPNSHLLPHYMA